jgi:hypothetical protein
MVALPEQLRNSPEFQAGVQQGNRVAAAAGVAGVVGLASGGAAASVLESWGAGAFVTTVGSSGVAGFYGSLAGQTTEVALGIRQSVSVREAGQTGAFAGALGGAGYGVNRVVSAVSPKPLAVHRLTEPGKPQFQLKKGEEGLSVFDARKVAPKDVLPYFREGSQVTTKTAREIESVGLTLKSTPGHPDLPKHLQKAHMEIQKPADMTRGQFKQAIKKLEPSE